MGYEQFVAEKLQSHQSEGIAAPDDIGGDMFAHQDALTRWALRRGRAAIFADTGLGKTRMQLVWADIVHRRTGRPVMILAPLAVAEQTVAEGREIGIVVAYDREESHADGIRITNYDRVHKFDADRYAGIVLDESSIIKHHDSKTFGTLCELFRHTPFKLCASATPAPNDWMELGTHAEFLGVMSRAEMLAEFFIHDGGETQKWRLKGHARDVFWRWVSEWGAMIRSPADLGFDASAYELPPINIDQHIVKSVGETMEGMLFSLEAQTLSERRSARRASVESRTTLCAELVNDTPGPWIVWCDLNAEADYLRAKIPGSVEVRGSDDSDKKADRMLGFSRGDFRVLITKPKIAGFGMNWQHCANVAFVGVSDSFEAYYQAIRRCWRFGQTREVNVHIIASELEGAVVANLKRKEADALVMFEQLSAETRDAVQSAVLGSRKQTNTYAPGNDIRLPSFIRSAA